MPEHCAFYTRTTPACLSHGSLGLEKVSRRCFGMSRSRENLRRSCLEEKTEGLVFRALMSHFASSFSTTEVQWSWCR